MPDPISPNRPSVAFNQGRLQGPAKPGETVEVVNVSANPEKALNSDGMEVRPDAWGRFNAKLPDVQEGDVLRVRTRSSNGAVSNWIQLQASGTGTRDTRNAQVDTQTLGLEANRQGSIDLVHLGNGMVSEPNAKLRFTNDRTGEAKTFTLDAAGKLPADASLAGKAGDSFSIAVSDGKNNVDFKEVAGVAKVEGQPEPVDLPDPAVWAKKHLDAEGKPTVKTERFNGPLFVDGAKPEDVKQGQLANCYFAAAMSSVAKTDPQALENMIKQNADGTYTVTFKMETFPGSGRFQDKKVNVDGDLYVRSPGGSPLYGSPMANGSDKSKAEMWFPILEKAWATLHDNSYDKVGNGGHSGKIMSAVLGVSTGYQGAIANNLDAVYSQLQKAQEEGRPVTAGTFGKDGPEAERYTGARLYAWHAYSVLGVEEKDGEKFVHMRNPWGSSEPGDDGKDDGIFKISLKDFGHYFQNINYALR